MSYNIDTWNTKELTSFVVPLSIIQKLAYTEVKLLEDSKIEADGLAEGFEIKGTLKDSMVLVDSIKLYGEGSGHKWENFLDMMKKSKGSLVATQVWEGGDSITKLIINDGNVTKEDVEI